MIETRLTYTLPSHPILLWLANSGQNLTPQIRSALLGELFNTPKAIIAALLNGLLFNSIGLYLSGNRVFELFIILDIFLVCLLIHLVTRVIRAARQDKPTPTGSYFVTAAAWCALQGWMAFTAMQTNIPPLQIISTATVMALVGMLCARNYAAPRYALTLAALCDFPFVAGALVSGDSWLVVFVLQTPLLLYSYFTVVTRFQSIATATMQADQNNHHRARHDPLTGLLNRLGLTEALAAQYQSSSHFILFYLDLDDFKPINDTFGHDIGDKILQAVSIRLRAAVRVNDIVARLGGDEFVIIAADLSAPAGTKLADTIIGRVGNEPYHLDSVGPLRIGISVGFACAPEDGLVGDDLHRKADAALYKAKEAGRGTHRRFSPTEPVKMPAEPVLI